MRLIVPCTALVLLASFGASARADDFLQQEGDLWRASKLVGVNIYGPDNKKVGDISDVLMNKDGKVTDVVVGVGGFLGIGQKDVAIPFDKVTFTQEAMPVPAQPAGTMAPAATANPGAAMPGTPSGGAATNAPAPGSVVPGTPSGGAATNAPAPGSVMPGTASGGVPASTATAPAALAPNAPMGLGTPAVTTATGGVAPAGGMTVAAMAPRSTAYPDHGTVDYTYDQLKAAPSFTYAK